MLKTATEALACLETGGRLARVLHTGNIDHDTRWRAKRAFLRPAAAAEAFAAAARTALDAADEALAVATAAVDAARVELGKAEQNRELELDRFIREDGENLRDLIEQIEDGEGVRVRDLVQRIAQADDDAARLQALLAPNQTDEVQG